MSNKDFELSVDKGKEILEIANCLVEHEVDVAKAPLIAAYFRMFYTKEDAIETIKKLNKDVLENDYKHCKEMDNEYDEDFLRYLSNYRKACCADDQWEGLLTEFSSHINDDPVAFFYELVQNADDCIFEEGVTPSFEAELYDNMIIIHHNEVGMTKANIIAISSAGESDKDPAQIGEKGIGFKTIFAKCERVDVVSGRYSFSLVDGGFHIAKFTPPDEDEYKNGTTMWLYFKEGADISVETLYEEICEKYGINGDKNMLFGFCPVMFTKNLRSISVKCGNRQFSVSTEKTYTALPREKHGNNNGSVAVKVTVKNDGEERAVTCFGIYEDVIPTLNAVYDRYNITEFNRELVKAQRIEIIAALDDEVNMGNMYSYLPCAQVIKAPISIQLPVKLNLNRTRMYFIGDSDTSAANDGKTVNAKAPETILWNEEMVEELTGMFPRFYKALRKELNDNEAVYRYIPDFLSDYIGLFIPASADEDYMNTYCNGRGMVDKIKSIPYFPVVGSEDFCCAADALVFDSLICTRMGAAYAWKSKLGVNGKPVEGTPAMLKYGGRIRLKNFIYPDEIETDDKKKAAAINKTTILFNQLIEETNQQSTVLNTLCEEYDIYKHINKADLRVFPADTAEGKKFISGSGTWFIGGELISKEDCFFHFAAVNEKEKSSFEAVGIELIPVSSKVDVLNVLRETKDNDFTLIELEELCFFLNDYGEESLSWCDQLLTKSDDGLAEAFARVVLRTLDKMSGFEMFTQLVKQSYITEIMKLQWNLLAQKLLGQQLDVTLPLFSELRNRHLSMLIDICNIINETPANKVKLSEKEKLVEYKPDDMERYSEIGITDFYTCANLPVPYLRLGNKLVLDSEDSLKEAVKEIDKDFYCIEDFIAECENAPGSKNEASTFEKHGKLLAKLTTVARKNLQHSMDFTPVTNTEYKPAYELLQNVDGKRESKEDYFGITWDGTAVTLEYKEKMGFSLWDFCCIVVKGISNQDKESTGKFGTGFKSIYSVCPKVEIFSRDIKCVLDTQAEVSGEYMRQKMKRSPVPIFSQCIRERSETTVMRLCFNSESEASDFYDELVCPENYVFLKNISYPLDGYTYSKENCFYCSYSKEGDDKPIFEVCFPLEYDEKKRYPVYCLLPMSDSEKLPFLLNLPQILTTNERTGISANPENREFNIAVLKEVLTEEYGLQAAFEALAEKHVNIAHSYAHSCEISGISPDFDAFEIYPYKECGKLKGYVSKDDITNIWSETKVFSGVFYWLLEQEKVSESALPADLLYIDRETAKLVGAEVNYSSILDKIYKTMEDISDLSDKDVKFINDCLPYLREELYSCDDELISIVKRQGLWELARFNGEDNAADYFERGDVAFWTLDGYRTYVNDGRKYYRIGNSEGIAPDFDGADRVICGTHPITPDGCVISLTDVFSNEDMTKEFLREEPAGLVKMAIDYNNINSCNHKALGWLAELVYACTSDDERKKYMILTNHILDKGENNKKSFIEMIAGAEDRNISNYYTLMCDLLQSDLNIATELFAKLVEMIPRLSGKVDRLFSILQNEDVLKNVDGTTLCKKEITLAGFIEDGIRIEKCFDLLCSAIDCRINQDVLKKIIELTQTISKADFERIFKILLESYCFPEEDYLVVLIRSFEEYKDERIYKIFSKNLNKDEAKTDREIVETMVQLAIDAPEKYYNDLLAAMEKCADSSEPFTLDGRLLTKQVDISKLLETADSIVMEVDSETAETFKRLTESQYPKLYNMYYNCNKNDDYSVFDDDDDGDKAVYFLRTSGTSCIVDGTLDGDDIVIVLYKQITTGLKMFLKDRCGIDDFMGCEKIKKWEKQSDCTEGGFSFSDEVLEHADELLDSDEETLIDELVAPYKADGVKFSGYGRSECCPICKGRLLAQASALTVKHILIHRDRFPLLMCGSCADFIGKYTNYVGFEKLSQELLMQSDAPLTLEIDLDEGAMREVIDMPFLHRAMLYRLISDNEQEE